MSHDQDVQVRVTRRFTASAERVFTWAVADSLQDESQDNSRVSIDIVPLQAGCELTLTHAMPPKWADYAGRTQAGWTTMLEALGRVLEPSTHAAPARSQP